MKSIVSWIENASWFSLGISVSVVALFGIMWVQAATTISTSVTTGASVYATSTISVTGLSSLHAGFVSTGSSTIIGALNVTDDIFATGTVAFTGLSSFHSGFVSTGSSTQIGVLNVTSNIFGSSTVAFGGLSSLHAGFVSTGSSTVEGLLTMDNASTTGNFSNIQVANTATTTAYLGCIQTYGTTTAQKIRLVFYASSTVGSVATSYNPIDTTAGGGVL